MTNKRISVIGGGAVGTAISAYYPDVVIYDKYHPRDPIEKAAAADYIFVAVPTPYNGGQDLREMDDAVAQVASHLVDPARQIVIIKSTVVPGTTDNYQLKYPEINFVFNPEFLTESTKEADFREPDKQLVGYTRKTRSVAEQVMAMLPPAPYARILPAKVCEMTKYMINSYYAFKVIFGNSVYDLCEKMEVDYESVRQGLVADSRIIDSHLDVFHGGYRGYGGKCLPKDVDTLAWLGREKKLDLELIENFIAINRRLKGEGKT